MRTILTALLVATSFDLAAPAAAASVGPRLGLEGGFQYAGVSNSLFGHLFDQESAFRPAWSAGATVELPVTGRLTLASGLRYVEYGEQVDVTLIEVSPAYEPAVARTLRIHNTWRYLAVPVRAKYRPAADRGLFVSLGPEIGWLLDVVNETEIDGEPLASSAGIAAAPAGQIFEQVGTFDDFRKFYNRWNATLAAGLGWEFPLWSHGGAVEVRYAEGLLDMAKSSAVTQRTRGVEAVLGLRW